MNTIAQNRLPKYSFFDRDLSWLSFSERILDEASNSKVPLMERIKFLSIFSSNLDEFYRVRMASLMALKEIGSQPENDRIKKLVSKVKKKILSQQRYYGDIIEHQIIDELRERRIHLLYDESLPDLLTDSIKDYFIHEVACFIHVVNLEKGPHFFPENNKIYLAVTTYSNDKRKQTYIVNVPSDHLPRFFSHIHQDIQYLVFLDDIVKTNLPMLFTNQRVIGCHSFKVTRDAELDLEDEFAGNLARKIERKLAKRDLGPATRFLHEPRLPKEALTLLQKKLSLKRKAFTPGGSYHNLMDLEFLPVGNSDLYSEPWSQIRFKLNSKSVFQEVKSRDVLLHPPYHTFDVVIRFFNEAAIDPFVEKIYVTLYRVAKESQIVNALISAAKNGKKVFVFVELKARFDEANNIKWSKKMKAAGVRVVESIPGLKVHAKVALVERNIEGKNDLIGLLATGNFNETTAKYYTDHILMTANKSILKEVKNLFQMLKKGKKVTVGLENTFKHLLVGQFNLQQRFIQLIDREILNAKSGKEASITIKVNNIEDRVLINKLYEASNSNVKISLVVRGVCCLVPGVKGMSENISIRRIVDRYLEHGRIFIFYNNGNPEVYLGSADWMNRNIYRRVEVCFPVYEEHLKKEIIQIMQFQLQDNRQAVMIDKNGSNAALDSNGLSMLRAQKEIGGFLESAMIFSVDV